MSAEDMRSPEDQVTDSCALSLTGAWEPNPILQVPLPLRHLPSLIISFKTRFKEQKERENLYKQAKTKNGVQNSHGKNHEQIGECRGRGNVHVTGAM